MDLKPQNFFIGIVDFFSVWLPGAILTWFLKIMFYDSAADLEKILQMPDNDTIRIIFFLLATYIIGSILFGFSSLLDGLYDKRLRNIFKSKDKDHFDLEVKTATAIKNTFINADEWILKHFESGDLTGEQIKKLYSKGYRYIINTYKWSQHYLLYQNPQALADVNRLEADSKFFRSLVLTFFIISIILIIEETIIIAIAFFSLSIISLYLFSKLRYKSTIKAYELVITNYLLQLPSSNLKGTLGISSSVLKSDLESSLLNKHRKTLDSLLKGFSNNARQVSINSGELENLFFYAEKNEWWYCLEGRGFLNIKNELGEQQHFLQPNAVIPIDKRIKYSFQNKQKEPLELIVINK